ncbi:hypothetical protein JRO89_XS15G0153900 [Xanthoceras sorbifolium]|uniref:Pollen Ole e 1 allergen and extensin family protein n=1 Tax=Xanthoceras sorbifolium TaxID=99658 RepID=A0ABQ8H2C5_9ROSI|nr:hypothetical protein JRO89_XS15G0153900 [Xanthoceras sorbifolium]
MELQNRKLEMGLFVFVLTTLFLSNVKAWTGEIRGRVVCDVCGDSSIGPEDHVIEGPSLSLSLSLCASACIVCITGSFVSIWVTRFIGLIQAGAEVAVLCITKSREVLNYQAFTDAKGRYTVAETMPESDRWDACLSRPISSFHEHCTHLQEGSTGVKFTYNHPSGHFHTIRPFVYRHASASTYCT